MPAEVPPFLILLLNSIATAIAYYLIAEKLMRPSKIDKLLCLLGLLGVQIGILLIAPITPIINLLVHVHKCIVVSFFVYQHNRNLFKSINIALSIYLIFTILAFMNATILFVFFNFSPEDSMNFGYNLIMQVLLVVSSILMRKYITFFFSNKINDAKILKFYLLFKAAFLVLLYIILTILNYYMGGMACFLPSILLALLVTTTVWFFFAKYNSELIMGLEKESRDISNLQVESEKVYKAYNEVIVFKHYYQGLFGSIIKYIAEKDMEGLEEYYLNYIAPISEQLNNNVGEYEQLNYIKNELIKARIVELINTVLQLPNIKLKLLIDSNIDNFGMKEMDFFKILNIYIDNAVEETSTQEKGNITISFKQEYDKLMFMIENSINGFESTPKPNNTHKGLKIVEEIISKYPKVKKRTVVQLNNYVQYIEIGNEYME